MFTRRAMQQFWPCGAAALVLFFGSSLPAADDALRPFRPSPDGMWIEQQREAAQANQGAGRPLVYRKFGLDRNAMNVALAPAPREFTPQAQTQSVVISLAMPDGRYARFRVVESSILAPALAAQRTDIRTFTARGIDEPTWVGRIDMTPLGFHASVLTPSGAFFIDPYQLFDTSNYMSYWKRDSVPLTDNWVCHVVNEAPVPAGLMLGVPNGDELKTYRLAVTGTGEYVQYFGSESNAEAAICTTVNRVNSVYENDLAIRLLIVAYNLYDDPNTDPFDTSHVNSVLTNANQVDLDAKVGSANYDIGHLMSASNGGGRAYLGGVCQANKARGATALPSPVGSRFDIDYVAHEMGHQFGANHTFNGTTLYCGDGQRAASSAYEPGSGSTIMCYAGICGAENVQLHTDAQFHTHSIDQILDYTNNHACSVNIATGNTIPTVNAGADYTIPGDTPFKLKATGSDPDGTASLTYCWEQFDLGAASPPANSVDGPLFRSVRPTADGVRTFPNLTDLLAGNLTPWEILPTADRTLNFRCTVRDNQVDGGGVSQDAMVLTVTTAGGPFKVTFPNNATTISGSQTITWDVGSTNGAPVNTANVNILLSIDGGHTFPAMLAANTPNDGSETITLPDVSTTTARVKVEAVGNVFFDISDVNFTIQSPNECPLANSQNMGLLTAFVDQNVLKIRGTNGSDSILIRVSSSQSGMMDVYSPIETGTPMSFDSTTFQEIHVQACGGDDIVVFDDSGGVIGGVSPTGWKIHVDGGDGNDIIVGGVTLDLNSPALAQVQSIIDTLQQAHGLTSRVLDLLGQVGMFSGGCNTIPCLVSNTASVVESAGNDLIIPAARYARDVDTELVRPTAATVREVHDHLITNYLAFLANDVQSLSQEAHTLSTNVNVTIDDFRLLLPQAQDLLSRAQSLRASAAQLGLATQNGDAMQVFMDTVESRVQTIVSLAGGCIDPDQPPTCTPCVHGAPSPCDPECDNENAQLPSGLPPLCKEAEERIEALESLSDATEARNDAEAAGINSANTIEGKGNAIEFDADALETTIDADEGGANSFESRFDALADDDDLGMVADADNFSTAANAMAVDDENWASQKENYLEAKGNNMYARAQTELLGASNTLRTRAQTDIVAPAEAIRAQAELILSDLEALTGAALPLTRSATGSTCSPSGNQIGCTPISPQHTLIGGNGLDLIVGTSGDDFIDGGSGNDLIFGGDGNDEIHGGSEVDVLVGGCGNDCIFGGRGMALGTGSFHVDLGDLFFGGDGNDLLVAGTDESDTSAEIDVMFGGSGDDRIRAGNGGVLTVDGFSFQFGNLVLGGDGKDDIVSGDGVDVIFGGDGDDKIVTGRGFDLAIGDSFSLKLGDLIFGDAGADTVHGDDPAGNRVDDDIDVIFGGDGADKIFGFGGGPLRIGSHPNNPVFELHMGNLVFGGDEAGLGDDIVTEDGIDVLFGGAGNDTITAGKGARLDIGNEFSIELGDLIFGQEGDDTLYGDDPHADRCCDDVDVIFGGDGKDTIRGFGGGILSIGDPMNPAFKMRLGNVIFGGDELGQGDDIATGDGVDVIFGGAGDDTIAAGKGDVLKLPGDFSIDLGDFVFGQDGNDTLHGDAPDAPSDGKNDGIDLFFGAQGDDTVYSGGGGLVQVGTVDSGGVTLAFTFGNLIFGGPGGDRLYAKYQNPSTPGGSDDIQPGIDLIVGAAGADDIAGGPGSVIFVGPIATPTLIPVGNILFGGSGGDTIKGANDAPIPAVELTNNLTLSQLSGNLNLSLDAMDLIFAGSGNDTVDAYNGIDLIFGSDGNDTLRADHGGLVIISATPIPFGNLIFGGDGEDAITSRGRLLPPEIDLIFGGPCDDHISAGNGFNIVFGNQANDTITAGTGINLLFGNRGDDTITVGPDISLNILFGNRGNDTITGGDGINAVFGNRGKDTIYGGKGINFLFGNRDNDTIIGGPDSSDGGLYAIFGNRGNDDLTGGKGLTLAFGNRGCDKVRGDDGVSLVFGNRGDDDVTGGNGVSLAFGNKGDDHVSTGNGLVLLFGNSGNDRLESGNGLSLVFGGSDEDILEGDGTGLFVAFGNSENDVIIGGSGVNLGFGNRGEDWLFGSNDTNIFFGNSGGDHIYGGTGKDFLFGNSGDDCIQGGEGTDYIFGNRDNDHLVSGNGNDFIFGNGGIDEVFSGPDGGCDWLFGNRGDDHVDGCQGATCDRLFGGRGNNTKTQNCLDVGCGQPSRGEIRGTILVDYDGDGIGDLGQAGVTVYLDVNNNGVLDTGEPSTLSTNDPNEEGILGNYRFTGLAHLSAFVVRQDLTTTPAYIQVYPSGPSDYYAGVILNHGTSLYSASNFVNRSRCPVSPDGWGCTGTACAPGRECLPVLVRRVSRCSSNGMICTDAQTDCPCGDNCLPSWEVVECACIAANDCHIVLDPVSGPTCAGLCTGGGQCNLIVEGDLYRCGGCPCPSVFAEFTFGGVVTSIQDNDQPPPFGRPPPWDQVHSGDAWEITYRFARGAADQDPSQTFGEYRSIAYFQLSVGSVSVSGAVDPNTTFIHNFSSQPTGVDQYEVSIPLAPSGPFLLPTDWFMELDDLSGTAWTNAGLNPRDALPHCGNINLGWFGIRDIILGSLAPPFSWTINGSVDHHSCTNCFSGQNQCLTCAGDLDGNHILNGADIQLFVRCFLNGGLATPACTCADMNADGVSDFADVTAFVAKLLTKAPCP